MIKIVYAASWLARRRFYSFSHALYRECCEWSEPGVWGGREVISLRGNPLLKYPHAFLVAMEEGRIMARMLVGCVDGRGYFSMFDAEENAEAVRLLMTEAAAWQKRRGVRQMIGPIAPHPLDLGGGVLIEGFEGPAAFGDAYNAPYYDKLLIRAGAIPYQEQAAYHVNKRWFDEEKYRRVSEWAKKRFGYEVRDRMTDSPRVLTDAICGIMGDEADREGMACAIGSVWPCLLKEMCPVVCAEGRPIGYLLTIRSPRKCGECARIVTMWVHEAWRRKGVTALLFDEAARAMIEMGIEEIDASWVRTDNEASIRSIENAGGSAMRRYRMYSVQI